MRLAGPDAGELLRAAFDDVASCEVRRVSTSTDGTTVGCRAVLRSGRTTWLGASTEPAPPGARVVDGVVVWRWPHDPWLPALRDAVSATAVAQRLSRPVERLVLRTYRPGRRAVVQGPGVFLKVLRADRAGDVAARYRLLHDSGLPVPEVLSEDPRGLVVLAALPGRQGRAALRAGRRLPPGDALLGLLDRLPAALLGLAQRPSWSDGAAGHAERVAVVLPEERGRVQALAAAVLDGTAGQPATDAVHGDLHEAQLLVAGGRVSGLLDVDRAGPGRRADDLACLLAHVQVLRATRRVAGRRADRLLEDWGPAFAAAVDQDELRLRTAGVLLSLATGPHRVQAAGWPEQTRALVELAEQALPR